MKTLFMYLTFLLNIYSINTNASSIMDESFNIYVLFGMPGAGKGTISQALKQREYEHFSIGDYFREEVRKGSNLGITNESKILSGSSLISSDIVEKIITEKILESVSKKKNLILDGFPKTIEQAIFFNTLIEERQLTNFIQFIHLKVDSDIAMARILTRRSCDECKQVYILKFSPPKQPGICDLCGGNLSQRLSDNVDDINRRIKYFEQITTEVVDFYEKNSKMVTFDANKSLTELTRDFLNYDNDLKSKKEK